MNKLNYDIDELRLCKKEIEAALSKMMKAEIAVTVFSDEKEHSKIVLHYKDIDKGAT